jgi:hypothetical protein
MPLLTGYGHPYMRFQPAGYRHSMIVTVSVRNRRAKTVTIKVANCGAPVKGLFDGHYPGGCRSRRKPCPTDPGNRG